MLRALHRPTVAVFRGLSRLLDVLPSSWTIDLLLFVLALMTAFILQVLVMAVPVWAILQVWTLCRAQRSAAVID